MVRVGVYVDGFNLYYGLKESYQRKYLWLDVQELATSLLRPGQTLEYVAYFTARVRHSPSSEARQSNYLDALCGHAPLVVVVDGRFRERPRQCLSCGSRWITYEEKETDVNIASALIEDAVRDRYDVALIVSADADLCPAVRSVKRLCPQKRVVVAFPPRRNSFDLKRAVDGWLIIGADKVRRAQLPSQVVTAAGVALARPKHWV